MPYQLVVVRGRAATQALKLGNGVTTVGRQEDCQLRIRSSQVSRKHCQLFEKKGLLIVKDLGSSNGTLVNGKKVDDQCVLEPGDELTIGAVKLKVEKVDAAAPAKAGHKPGDTAVAEPVLVGEEDAFEVTLDDGADTDVGLPAAKAAAPAAAKAPPKKAEDEPIEVSEDAVAGFLLDIELDEEDKA